MLAIISVLLLILPNSYQPSPGQLQTAKEHQREATPKKTESKDSDKSPNSSFNDNQQKYPAENSQEKSSTDWWAIVNSGLITLFTGVLAYLAHRQRLAMDKQAKHMEDGLAVTVQAAEAATLSAKVAELSLKLTQCADVLVDTVSIIDRRDGKIATVTKDSRVILTLKNFGNTRAEDLRVGLWLDIPGLPRADDHILGPFILGAGDTQDISFATFVEFLTEQTANDINSGKIILRVRGSLSYKDVFGEVHKNEIPPIRYSARNKTFRDEESPDGEHRIKD